MSRRLWLRALCLTVGLSTATWGQPARANGTSARQVAPVVARVLSYERTLVSRAQGSIDLVILFDPSSADSSAEARSLDREFAKLSNVTVQGLPLRARTQGYDPNSGKARLPSDADVVLVCPGLESALGRIARQARAAKVLTIGVRREHATDATSLAVIVESGRLRILANLSHANAEGVELSAQLLRRSEIL